MCISLVWRSKDLGLNGNFDEILESQYDERKEMVRSQSMEELKVKYDNDPFEVLSDDSHNYYLSEDNGAAPINETEKLKEFHEFMNE
jgi:hypothetical protein